MAPRPPAFPLGASPRTPTRDRPLGFAILASPDAFFMTVETFVFVRGRRDSADPPFTHGVLKRNTTMVQVLR
jgi:hypothetical protein